MNLTNHKTVRVLALITALTGLATTASAQSGNPMLDSTGVSDETLFMILAVAAVFQVIVIIAIANAIKAIAGAKSLWENGGKGKAAALIGMLMLASGSAMAADDNSYDSLITMGDTGFIALLLLNAFLFVVFIYLVVKLNQLMRMVRKQTDGHVPASFIDKLNDMLTDAVPVEKEDSVEMDHEYDGIRELDNNLPPWWLYGFYVSIVFAVIYIGYYHFSSAGQLQAEEYQAELLEAEQEKAAAMAAAGTEAVVVDENNVEYMAAAEDLKAGQKLYRLNCVTCHGQDGGSMPGGVGPNLADDYWLHGGSINDIFKTIKYGVTTKGMQAWERNFTPLQMQQLTSYIVSIRGSNVENPKEPQGELWEGEATDDAGAAEAEPQAEEIETDSMMTDTTQSVVE